MQRNLILLGLLVLIGAASYFLVNKDNGKDRTAQAGLDRQFAVPDTNVIGKIFLADRYQNKTTLRRQGDGWLLNDTYPARQDAVKNLLRAVGNVQVKFKPPKSAEKYLIESLSTEGIKVEVYDRQDKLLKQYYVGGATNDETGTYMILEGFDQPYVTHIPGFTGNLRFRYNLVGNDWRDRYMFRARVNEIERISVNYPKQRSKSFIIERQGNNFDVKPYYSTTREKLAQPIRAKIEQYLTGFKAVGTAGFRDELAAKDSLQTQTPFVDITVEKKDGSIQQAMLLPKYNKPIYDEKTQTFTQPSDAVSNYFITNQDGDLLITQHTQVEPLLWAYDFFYPAEEESEQ